MGDSDSESVPSDIEGIAQNVVDSLLPEKSRQTYEQAYVKLEDWCKGKGIKNSRLDIVSVDRLRRCLQIQEWIY